MVHSKSEVRLLKPRLGALHLREENSLVEMEHLHLDCFGSRCVYTDQALSLVQHHSEEQLVVLVWTELGAYQT
jgi:hypothetical protein